LLHSSKDKAGISSTTKLYLEVTVRHLLSVN